VVLAILATISIQQDSFGIDVLLLAIGAFAVGMILFRFSDRKRSA
jgi:hypothetical protein